MRKIVVFIGLILAFSVCFISCKDDERFENCNAVISCSPLSIVDETSSFDSIPIDNIQVQSVKFDKNFIILNLKYGSCRKSEHIVLNVNKAIMKSLPPQQDAKLVLEKQLCEALFYYNQDVCVDRSSIRDETILNLQLPDTTLKLHLPKIQ